MCFGISCRGVLLTLLAAAPIESYAQLLTPVSQDRRVEATMVAPAPQSDTDQAADFGPFDASVNVSSGNPFGQASASQDSEILDDGIVGSMATSISTVSGLGEPTGFSVCSVVFDVASSLQYELTYHGTEGSGSNTVLLELRTEEGALLFSASGNGQNDVVQGTKTGYLAAGHYRLMFRATSVPGPFSSAAWQNVTLSVAPVSGTCAGDLDDSGAVDAQDLAMLLSAYQTNAGGDLDGDNDTDAADLALLLADWGCLE